MSYPLLKPTSEAEGRMKKEEKKMLEESERNKQ